MVESKESRLTISCLSSWLDEMGKYFGRESWAGRNYLQSLGMKRKFRCRKAGRFGGGEIGGASLMAFIDISSSEGEEVVKPWETFQNSHFGMWESKCMY